MSLDNSVFESFHQFDERISMAQTVAFYTINKRAVQKKSIFKRKMNAVGNAEIIVREDFVRNCPLAVRFIACIENGNKQSVCPVSYQEQEKLPVDRQSSLDRYKARRERRNAVAEQSDLERLVLQHTLSQYSSLVNQDEMFAVGS